MNRVHWTTLLLFLAVGGSSLVVGCSSSPVRYQPYRGAELSLEQWLGDWAEVAIVQAPSPDVWTLPHDTLAAIEFDRYEDRVVTSYRNSATSRSAVGQPITRRVSSVASCRGMLSITPADSIHPPVFRCTYRREPSTDPEPQIRTVKVATDLGDVRQLAWKLGGHAVILTTGTVEIVRGYVIRCRVEDRVAQCI